MSSKRQIGRARVFHLQNQGHITTENDFPELCKWYLILTNINFKKVGWCFSNLPKCNPSQSSPVLSIHAPSWLSCVLFEFFYSLDRYFHILVNSMTIWSVLKLSKIAWPSAFNKTHFALYSLTWLKTEQALQRSPHFLLRWGTSFSCGLSAHGF